MNKNSTTNENSSSTNVKKNVKILNNIFNTLANLIMHRVDLRCDSVKIKEYAIFISYLMKYSRLLLPGGAKMSHLICYLHR